MSYEKYTRCLKLWNQYQTYNFSASFKSCCPSCNFLSCRAAILVLFYFVTPLCTDDLVLPRQTLVSFRDRSLSGSSKNKNKKKTSYNLKYFVIILHSIKNKMKQNEWMKNILKHGTWSDAKQMTCDRFVRDIFKRWACWKYCRNFYYLSFKSWKGKIFAV